MTTTDRTIRLRTRSALSIVASCTVLATTAALTPALLTPAHAVPTTNSPTTALQRSEPLPHRVAHRDARRDVFVFDLPDDSSRPAPRNRTTDVRTTVVDHRADELLIRTRVRQLSRSGYRLMVSEILTSDGRRYELVVDYSLRPIGPRISLTRSGSAADVSCPDASWSFTGSVEQIEATVPTSCLRTPGWVRVGVGVVSSPRDLTRSWADDSRTRGRVGEHLVLGPRQPRA